MNNLSPGKQNFKQIVPSIYTLVGGVVGWVDYDWSATTGLDDGKLWMWAGTSPVNAASGMRTPGDTGAWIIPKYEAWGFVHGKAGHIELYRTALDTTYFLTGYFLW